MGNLRYLPKLPSELGNDGPVVTDAVGCGRVARGPSVAPDVAPAVTSLEGTVEGRAGAALASYGGVRTNLGEPGVDRS
jgi:hypothetical protein